MYEGFRKLSLSNGIAIIKSVRYCLMEKSIKTDENIQFWLIFLENGDFLLSLLQAVSGSFTGTPGRMHGIVHMKHCFNFP